LVEGKDELKHKEPLASLAQPYDIINVVFVAFLLGLTIAFYDHVINIQVLIPLYVGMLVTVCSLIWFVRSDSNPILFFLRKWYPVPFVLLTFFSLGSIVHHVMAYDVDSRLIAIDLAMFGEHPTVFMSHFVNSYLVDFLTLCYASFYFLPVILGATLYWKRKLSDFEMFAAIICLGFYLSDIGNILFPASGPSQTLGALHVVPLEGKFVGDFIRTVIFVLEPYRWDCFPSGHVTVTLITLALCYRFERRLFWWMLPVSVGLIISTVYLRYHYVVDVFAGILLASVIVGVAGITEKVWARVRQPKWKLPLGAYSADKDIS
jgi:membrane-associated phospholipid phosphatase